VLAQAALGDRSNGFLGFKTIAKALMSDLDQTIVRSGSTNVQAKYQEATYPPTTKIRGTLASAETIAAATRHDYFRWPAETVR